MISEYTDLGIALMIANIKRQEVSLRIRKHTGREIRQESNLTHQYEENPIRMMGFSFYIYRISDSHHIV